MSEVNIAIPAGQSRRLLTGGKYCPDNIVVRAEKPVPIEEKDVNFWDYDGTLLYSYTLEEANALTELPPGPTWHEELAFVRWNWDLDILKTLTYQVDIGALYQPKDKTTHLHIELLNAQEVSLVANGTGYIDWGDGSPRTELVDAPNSTVSTHAYINPGAYIIRVGSDTSKISLGFSDGRKNCFNGNTRALRKAFTSSTSCAIHPYCFKDCVLLEYATFGGGWPPKGAYQNARNLACMHIAGEFLTHLFNGCYSLRLVTGYGGTTSYMGPLFPQCLNGCYSLRRFRSFRDRELNETYQFNNDYSLQEANGSLKTGNGNAFLNCYSLVKFDMSPKSTGLGNSTFKGCSSLEELDIREKVTAILESALSGCSGMRRLRFRPTKPPTVANANAFTGIPASCVVEVPAASLEAYRNATNYAPIAAQMVGV